MVAQLFVPGQFGNTGRSRWMPDGRTLVSWGANEASDDRRSIESFGVSPVDGRIVVSAGWGERDVMLAEGIPGIGESLRKR